MIAASPAQAQSWPTRTVKFIVPFGPGAGADIGARLFAERLAARWGQPVVIENKPGGDSIVAINAFLAANDDHTFLFGPSGNFTVHPFVYSKLSLRPEGPRPDRARLQHHPGGRGGGERALQHGRRNSPRPRARSPGKFNSGLVQGITEFTFWGYCHHEGLNITQVPYRDINVAPVDLGENRIQVVMSSLAIVQPQWQAGRIKLIAVNNRTRVPAAPERPDRARSRLPVARGRGTRRPVRAQDHAERAEGAHRRRLQRGRGRRRDRGAAAGHRAGDQRRRAEGIRRRDRGAARQGRRHRQGDRLQAEAMMPVMGFAALNPSYGLLRQPITANCWWRRGRPPAA